MAARLMFAGVLVAVALVVGLSASNAHRTLVHPTKVEAVVLTTPSSGPPSPLLSIAPYERPIYHPPQCHWGCPGRHPIVRVTPDYPQRCGARGAMVRLRLRIAPRGEVIEATVIDSSDPCFDLAARTATIKWRYVPKPDGPERVEELGIRFVEQEA